MQVHIAHGATRTSHLPLQGSMQQVALLARIKLYVPWPWQCKRCQASSQISWSAARQQLGLTQTARAGDVVLEMPDVDLSDPAALAADAEAMMQARPHSLFKICSELSTQSLSGMDCLLLHTRESLTSTCT